MCEVLKMDVDGIFLSVLKPTLKTHPDTLWGSRLNVNKIFNIQRHLYWNIY